MTCSAGRVGLSAFMGLVLGCAKGDPSIVDNASGAWQLPGSSGENDGTNSPSDSGNGDTAGQTSMADGTDSTTTEPMGTSGSGTTTTPPPMESSGGDTTTGMSTFGDDGGRGMQPDSGWWAHCIPNMVDCEPDFTCLSTDAGTDGVCTMACNPPGNPGDCGMSPGGTSSPVCLSVGGNSLCALDCEAGLTCAGGMVCVSESDDNGPISVCL